MNLVLDPSVVIKWYIPEVLSREAVSLKEWIVDSGAIIMEPELFYIESANVIWKKSTLRKEISRSNAKSIFTEIMSLPFQTVPDRNIITIAYETATLFSVTVYDAIYLACAYKFQGKFLTADRALSKRLTGSALEKLILPLEDFENYET